MGIHIIDRIQARLELLRLEQRYTRRRNRRSTFVSNAVYVNGEYVYNTPNTTGSSTTSTSSSGSGSSSSARARTRTDEELTSPSSESQRLSAVERPDATTPRKKLNRWPSMPGFGSMSSSSSPRAGHQF